MIKIAIFWQQLASEWMITWTISGAKARLQIDEVNIKLNIMYFPLLRNAGQLGGRRLLNRAGLRLRHGHHFNKTENAIQSQDDEWN